MRFTAAIALGLPAILALVGCDGLNKLKGGGDSGAAAANGAADAGPATKAAAKPQDGVHTIDGVGDVPAWAPDHGKPAKCAPSAAAQARFKAVEKGDDAQLVAGTADIAGMIKEVSGDDCFASRKGLAEALNNGGYKRYGLKKFDEANRFWRASLTVRPAFLLARYNLACGLGLASKGKDAVTEILEIARAAKEGDASAANFLEKAKTDDDLKSVREDATFKEALRASQGGLVGPRKGSSEPEVGKKAIPLLADDFQKAKDPTGSSASGFITFKPAVVNIWTWRPSKDTELMVTTITSDPTTLGKPKGGDFGVDYGAVAVYRRDGEKLSLLLARKTGENPPAVASGKNGTVAYTFEAPCGTLSGSLTWNGRTVEVKEKTCQDL